MRPSREELGRPPHHVDVWWRGRVHPEHAHVHAPGRRGGTIHCLSPYGKVTCKKTFVGWNASVRTKHCCDRPLRLVDSFNLESRNVAHELSQKGSDNYETRTAQHHSAVEPPAIAAGPLLTGVQRCIILLPEVKFRLKGTTIQLLWSMTVTVTSHGLPSMNQ